MAREWKGPDYAAQGNAVGGLRLMILGESMWHSTKPIGTDEPDMNEWLIESVLSGKKYDFYNKLSRLVTNGGQTWLTQAESVAFWRSVVFYNYIPAVAANRAGQRPPEGLWSGATPDLFRAVIRRTEIEAILVCGAELWRHLPSALPIITPYEAGGEQWDGREFEVAGDWRAVAAHIPHPSGSRGWSYERCRPVVDFLFKRANELRAEKGILPAIKPKFRGVG